MVECSGERGGELSGPPLSVTLPKSLSYYIIQCELLYFRDFVHVVDFILYTLHVF